MVSGNIMSQTITTDSDGMIEFITSSGMFLRFGKRPVNAGYETIQNNIIYISIYNYFVSAISVGGLYRGPLNACYGTFTMAKS